MLRREFAALKPAHVPDAPTHASRLAAATASTDGDADGVDPATRARRDHRMTGRDDHTIDSYSIDTYSVVGVTAGLSQPSSSRLLAERLIEATADPVATRPERR